ncbi:MAG: hypothetical protein H6684_05855 [Deltaproteobacteria bacterium]|nr:hypothetical protein [Deltaproteobacteria bacterium]
MKRTRPAKRAIFALLITVFLFLFVNAIVSMRGWDKAPEEEFFTDVFSVITEVIPNARIPFANAGAGPERVNNLGFRGPDTTWDKPPGVKRFLVLGDSSAFGVTGGPDLVPLEQTFTGRVGIRLQEQGHWEWINAGIPGTNILQHRLLYNLKLYRLHPDVVLVYVVPNVRADMDALRAVYEHHEGKDRTATAAIARWLRRWPVYRALKLRIRGSVSTEVRNQVEAIYDQQRTDEDQQYLLDGFADDLNSLRAKIVEGGARPIWVYHINRMSVLELAASGMSADQIARNPLMQSEGAKFFDYVRDFARRHGDVFVNPYPDVVEAQRAGVKMVHDDVHPTAEGHGQIAKAIIEAWEKTWETTRTGDP